MNMGYCRFENTLQDLEDCEENIPFFDPETASKHELASFKRLLILCERISQDYSELISEINENPSWGADSAG